MDPHNAFIQLAPPTSATPTDAATPLAGLRVSVKDNFAWQGLAMTCASDHLRDYHPPYDATLVARLRRAGATLVGKTNMDEFAAGSSGETSAYGPTQNPAAPGRVPGGSSSGAAASVAAGLADIALGSDTGGSVRCPAAFCGVIGYKPTQGVLSRYGMADLAMSLDTPGWLARNLTLIARAMDATVGADSHDATTHDEPAAFVTALEEAAAPARLLVANAWLNHADDQVQRPVRAALAKLEAAGHELIHVDAPPLDDAVRAYYVINFAEFGSAMNRYDGRRYGTTAESVEAARATFGAEVKRRILMGAFVSAHENRHAWLDAASAARDRLTEDLHRPLREHDADAWLLPTMPVPPWPMAERLGDVGQMYAADAFTVPANLARMPAISLPIAAELPTGLQLMAAHRQDAKLFTVTASLATTLRRGGDGPV